MTSSSPPGAHWDAALVPIVIGVSGHRDLDPQDAPRLEAAVDSLLEELHRDYPASPFIVLSPLADGADRLVARVALRRKARLVVPMPFSEDEYRRDFTAPGSLAEFDALLSQASERFSLRLRDGITEQQVRDERAARDGQYAAVGSFVAGHSQIFIALWDGLKANGLGGTGNAVEYRLHGPPARFARSRAALDPPETGPVHHIWTPHQKLNAQERMELGSKAFTRRILLDKPAREETSMKAMRRIDLFNQDVRALTPRLVDNVKKSRSWVTLKHAKHLPVRTSALLDRYSVTDALALHYQTYRARTWKALLVLGGLAVLTFLGYEHLALNPDWAWLAPWLPLVQVSLWALAYAAHRRARRNMYEDKHLEYRALAEGLRVQYYWAAAGLRHQAADHYLRKQRTPLDWILTAMRDYTLPPDEASGPPPEPSTATLELLQHHWVDNQRAWFTRRAKEKETESRMREWTALLLLGAAVAVLVLLGLFHLWSNSWINPAQERLHIRELVIETSSSVVGLLLALAGLLKGYAEKLALEEEVQQYSRMAELFARSSAVLTEAIRAGKIKEAQSLLVNLGEEALIENGDWVLLHRARPMAVPTP